MRKNTSPPKQNIFVYGEHFRSCSLAYVLSLGQINSYLKKKTPVYAHTKWLQLRKGIFSLDDLLASLLSLWFNAVALKHVHSSLTLLSSNFAPSGYVQHLNVNRTWWKWWCETSEIGLLLFSLGAFILQEASCYMRTLKLPHAEAHREGLRPLLPVTGERLKADAPAPNKPLDDF